MKVLDDTSEDCAGVWDITPLADRGRCKTSFLCFLILIYTYKCDKI
jgi:hypothetical protein